MSFKTVEPAPARLNRSELAVPGSQPKLFAMATMGLPKSASVMPVARQRARAPAMVRP